MPPARTIIVNTDRILTTIATTAAEQHDDALAHGDGLNAARLAEEVTKARWVPRDLQQLAGKPLTASERKRHQEAMRQMEVGGLIVLDTRHVRLTEEGTAAVEKLQHGATVDG